jgi:hypothetical protein
MTELQHLGQGIARGAAAPSTEPEALTT